jgi:hypothetical protein
MKMHAIQGDSIVNLIQIEWIQQFQHCMESRLIQVMNVKMHSMQFGLIVNEQERKEIVSATCVVIQLLLNRSKRQFRLIVNPIPMKRMKGIDNHQHTVTEEPHHCKRSPPPGHRAPASRSDRIIRCAD